MKQRIAGQIAGHRSQASAESEARHLACKTGRPWRIVWHGERGGYYTVEEASPKTLLVYGLAAGEAERWREQLLCESARTVEDVERVKAAAARDGWHSFRVAEFVEGSLPDFGRAVCV